jgi:hypothetical protein
MDRRRVWTRLACLALAFAAGSAEASRYDVDYSVRFRPEQRVARVTLAIAPGDARPSRLDFRMPAARYAVRHADGTIVRDGDRLRWLLPPAGGTLVYDYRIGTRRANGAFDSRITRDWVVVRGDDLVPPARVLARIGASSNARLRIALPRGWHEAETPYPRDGDAWLVDDPRRRFDRPVGWIVAGDVGVERGRVGGMEVAIAAPHADGASRDELAAMLARTLPQARDAFATLPAKMLIVRAGDPMWRGGLSGPRSFWLHADRPLVEPDGTSPVLHELTHSTTRLRAEPGADWIVEGIAEFYSLELRRRAGALGPKRFERIIAGLEKRARRVASLHTSHSRGARTAAAVVLLHRLDREVRARTQGRHDIDDVTAGLVAIGKVGNDDLRAIVEDLVGAPAVALGSPLLPRDGRGRPLANASP